MILHRELTGRILDAATKVHTLLGPGLLESAYEECLCRELRLQNIPFRQQIFLPLTYEGLKLDCGYRLDVVVANLVILELKCVENLLPIHEAQLMTYLRLSGLRLGLLINFNVELLKHGIKRRIL